MNCHLLITVLNPAKLDMATLVFRTIKTGFPTASVTVYSNGCNSSEANGVIQHAAMASGAVACQQLNATPSHGEWIEWMIAREHAPFWIVDADTVFFDRVEHWFDGSNALFAGRYEPEFWESWTKTVHVARLHPSMMWINPVPMRAAMRGWPGKHEFFDSVQKELIRWHWVPVAAGGGALQPDKWQAVRINFYDTCAGLHHALGGLPFTDAQNAAYEHLFCGSYAGMMPGMEALEAVQRAVVADSQSARGLWQAQQRWYAENVVL